MSKNAAKTPPSTSRKVLKTIRGVRDALSVSRVFGDAYEVGDTTVIPVARVVGGAGGGGGESNDGDDLGSGFGTGFALHARPIGAYQVRNGEVSWKPAVDVTRLAKGGQALGGLAMICATMIILRRSR